MALSVALGNVLDQSVDGLILTIDGTKAGMEGNIARQFAHRYPDDWKDVSGELTYPIPIGRAVGVSNDGDSPFRVIIFASTLHHLDTLSDTQKISVVRTACSEALAIGSRNRLRSMATAVMRGGWRLGIEEAFGGMLDALQGSPSRNGGLDFRIVVPSREEANRLIRLASERNINLRFAEP